MNLYEDLNRRGLIHQTTDPKLEKLLESEEMTFYIGFDPTSDSLHLGSLLPLLTMKRLQEAGHKPIAVVGGATGMIGDPSGKSAERQLLDKKTLAQNQNGLQNTIGRFLKTTGPKGVRVLNNISWFEKENYIDFLREIGKHFTVNHMLAKESVRARLEDRDHGISYTEFSYMLLQAYDFYYLHKKNGCTLQLGGSDQWGNITAGCELIRRKGSEKEAYGITFPLVTKSDGSKFGKSEKGNVWLDDSKTSAYEFYQFLLNSSDDDVMKLIRFFTFLEHSEMDQIEEESKKDPGARIAQKRLAEELTLLVHGKKELENVQSASKALFSKSGGDDIKSLSANSLKAAFSDAPSTELRKSALKDGILLAELLAQTKLCGSKGAARRDISGGGIYLNNERISDQNLKVGADDLIDGTYVLLRKGKKNYHLISFT